MLRKSLLAVAFMLCTVGLSESFIDETAPRVSHRRQAPQQSAPAGTGGIEGRVLDAEGRPVAKAMVMYTRVGDSGTAEAQPLIRTNRRGGFSFEGLAPGTYVVNARKEEDGYPFTFLQVYRTGLEVVPRVVVNAGETTSDVVVRFGPRAAEIVGKLVDADTGEPISGASLTIREPGDPKPRATQSVGLEATGGGFKFLVPPAPYTVELSAPGYEAAPLDTQEILRKGAQQTKVALRKSSKF